MERAFDAERTLRRVRGCLKRTEVSLDEVSFPEHLVEEIRAALENEETRCNMMEQLLLLCDVKPSRDDVKRMRMEGGKLLYSHGERCVIWGTEDHFIRGTQIIREPRMIGGKPCWTLRRYSDECQAIVWGDRVGTWYPEHSTGSVHDAGGVPCYLVNDERDWEKRYGFVVTDEKEGSRFVGVSGLAIAGGRPVYVAFLSKDRNRQTLVWGDETICEGHLISSPIVIDDTLFASVRLTDESFRSELWCGHLRIERQADSINGPSAANGKLAYAVWKKEKDVTRVVIGEQTQEWSGRVFDWKASSSGGADVIVYVIRRDNVYSVYANFTEVCEGATRPDLLGTNPNDATMRVRFENEREPRSLDLRALGIV